MIEGEFSQDRKKVVTASYAHSALLFGRLLQVKSCQNCGKKLGIECNLTSIIFRHSFSTRLKRSGVSTEFIRKSLRYSGKRTTENYLDGFDNEI